MFSVLILAALTIMLASLAGVITIWNRLGSIIERNLSVLVSFSAGVFLLIVYALTTETLEHAASPSLGIAFVVLGIALALVLFRNMPGFHHHHDTQAEEHTHSHIDTRRILASDAVHNMGDGILLAAAFSVSTEVGIITTVSVFIHELVQEVSEFFVLRQGGYSVRRALALNALVSSTVLVGAIGGYFLLETFEQLEAPLIGIAAGMLLVVVVHDLIPHSIRSSRQSARYGKHLAWFALGALLMWSLGTVAGHEVDATHAAEAHRSQSLAQMRLSV